MAQFDFIESATNGYRFLWDKRAIIIRTSLPVIILKIITYIGIFMLGYEEAYMRHGLILLPSTFAEGWIIALLIRMAMFHEPPVMPASKEYPTRRQFLIASTLIYTLIKLAFSAIAGSIMTYGLNEMQASPDQEPAMQSFIISILILAFLIWSLRLIWLYIPVAMGIRPLAFLKRTKAFSYSLYFIGIALMCALPLMMLFSLAIQIINSIIPLDEANQSLIQMLILASTQSITELAMSINMSLAIGYACYAIFFEQNKNKG